ncbi:MAG: SIMPL domain-containing protein [Pseudomonadota bacterium]
MRNVARTGGLCLLALVAFGAHAAELRGTPKELRDYLQSERTDVRVVGESEIVAYTDTAVVTIVVRTKEKTLSASLGANQSLRTALTRDLEAAGVAKEAIRSTAFSSSPTYRLFGRKPSSYEVVNRLTVKVGDEGQLQRVSTLVDAREEFTIGAVDFEDSREDALKRQADLAALDDAREAAQQYADRLGLTVEPRAFTFEAIRIQASRAAMVMEEAAMAGSSADSYSLKADRVAQPTSFDERTYRSRVTVTFEVVD